MRKILLAFALLFSIQTKAQQTYETISVAGQTREYYKYLPTGYDSATEQLPIIIILHGLGGDALSMTGAGINQIADTARFIPLYLQGLPNFLGQNSWNNATGLASTGEDILFISQIIDEINSIHGIDLTRVYMVGISMGAIMTFHALTELNNRIAAVSCHIGTMSTQDITNYNPTFTIPVQQIHGTNDQTVPYDGTPLQTLSLVPETLTKLKAVNGWVAGDSTITNIPNIANDGITIEKIEYNCTNADLEHWKMNGADHIFLFQPPNDTNGVFVSWYFLRQYSHPNPIPLGNYKLKKSDFKVEFYPNPAHETITLTNTTDIKSINIYNMSGQLIKNESISNSININHLSKGIYIIEFINTSNEIFKDKLIID